MRTLHQLRALPHVPGRVLLGADRRNLLRRQRRRCGPRRFRRCVPLRGIAQSRSERSSASTQLLGDEAWASFARGWLRRTRSSTERQLSALSFYIDDELVSICMANTGTSRRISPPRASLEPRTGCAFRRWCCGCRCESPKSQSACRHRKPEMGASVSIPCSSIRRRPPG